MTGESGLDLFGIAFLTDIFGHGFADTWEAAILGLSDSGKIDYVSETLFEVTNDDGRQAPTTNVRVVGCLPPFAKRADAMVVRHACDGQ